MCTAAAISLRFSSRFYTDHAVIAAAQRSTHAAVAADWAALLSAHVSENGLRLRIPPPSPPAPPAPEDGAGGAAPPPAQPPPPPELVAVVQALWAEAAAARLPAREAAEQLSLAVAGLARAAAKAGASRSAERRSAPDLTRPEQVVAAAEVPVPQQAVAAAVAEPALRPPASVMSGAVQAQTVPGAGGEEFLGGTMPGQRQTVDGMGLGRGGAAAGQRRTVGLVLGAGGGLGGGGAGAMPGLGSSMPWAK